MSLDTTLNLTKQNKKNINTLNIIYFQIIFYEKFNSMYILVCKATLPPIAYIKIMYEHL